jgi:hypothetical protein
MTIPFPDRYLNLPHPSKIRSWGISKPSYRLLFGARLRLLKTNDLIQGPTSHAQSAAYNSFLFSF